MTLNLKNQNDILNLEKLNSNEIEYIFSDKPINRLKTKPQLEDKIKLLSKHRDENLTVFLQILEYLNISECAFFAFVSLVATQVHPNSYVSSFACKLP